MLQNWSDLIFRFFGREIYRKDPLGVKKINESVWKVSSWYSLSLSLVTGSSSLYTHVYEPLGLL